MVDSFRIDAADLLVTQYGRTLSAKSSDLAPSGRRPIAAVQQAGIVSPAAWTYDTITSVADSSTALSGTILAGTKHVTIPMGDHTGAVPRVLMAIRDPMLLSWLENTALAPQALVAAAGNVTGHHSGPLMRTAPQALPLPPDGSPDPSTPSPYSWMTRHYDCYQDATNYCYFWFEPASGSITFRCRFSGSPPSKDSKGNTVDNRAFDHAAWLSYLAIMQ